jgi:hypothetical protein
VYGYDEGRKDSLENHSLFLRPGREIEKIHAL